MMKTLVIVSVIGSIFALAGCDQDQPSADTVQNQRQAESDKQAVMSVPFPTITNYAEKRELKQIYEMRDQSITTYTYFIDRDAKLHKLCDSIGYPIPYSTEFTSPMRPATSSETPWQGNMALPQSDPNGLFSPAEAAGTWVLCHNPNPNPPAGQPTTGPVYAEPDVIASPFPLDIK
jgi:hypothetical protein